MIRVAHVSTALSWRGGEQQVFYLAEELAKIGGIAQWVFCAKGSVMAQRCHEAGLPYQVCTKGWSFNPFFAHSLAVFCRKNRLDLLHLHDPHAHNFAVLSADIWGNTTPFVLSRRVDFVPKNNRYTHYKYNHTAIKKIVCVSESIRRVMLPHIEQAEKLEVIYSGIDLDRFAPKNEKWPSMGSIGILRRQYNLSADTLLVGNVAALAPHKDYYTFLDTARLLLANGFKARFLLIGEGGERVALAQYAAAIGVADHVIFTGFRTDIAQILPELDLMLVTSVEEGLGTSVLDAFVAGVPVVATQAGGLRELVQHQINGLNAPIKDAQNLAICTARLLVDGALRKKLTEQARLYVQDFSKEKTAQKTLALYKNILELAQIC